MNDKERLKEQIRIEEQAHFFTEKKELVDSYRREKKQGYSVEVYPALPKGWVVTSHLHLAIGGK